MKKRKLIQRTLPKRVPRDAHETSMLLSSRSGQDTQLELERLLNITGERDGLSFKEGQSNEDERKCHGIRYITEDMILRVSKQDNIAFVQSLNLSVTKTGDKKFKYIENLDKCARLRELNLSHNCIEKVEKLEKLHKLRELNISDNQIIKIEGLEHMTSLEVLNLSDNYIEQLPLWLPKKLRSLQTLNLRNNNISSLHELARLKLLKNLTELVLAENPVCNLPHYRLFLLFHVRSLQVLDGQPVNEQERQQAHQRFHIEEIERLEHELEARMVEIERLQDDRNKALESLVQQEALSHTLQAQNREQRRSQDQMERELETKSELLKQKTMELTRACQKQYELEQELAFHKIDVKFESIPLYFDQDLNMENSPGESPYIGKARHKRNIFNQGGVKSDDKGQAAHLLTETDSPGDALRQTEAKAETRLRYLHQEIEKAEQQIVRVSGELNQLEEAASQKRISEAEKEQLRQQLQNRIQHVNHLRAEAEDVEKQLDRQRMDMNQAQSALDKLQSQLDSLDPSDPRHAHVKAQVSSKTQLLDIMSKRFHELQCRLDDMLSRIARETEEIKDLEQQLTDGQIAANEALKQDLEAIISGLQEYLCSVKDQARATQRDCQRLQRENESLQHLLKEKDEQCSQLQDAALSAEKAHEEMIWRQQDLDSLRRENERIREVQGQASAYEARLEAQLQARETEATQLKEELSRLRRVSQMEHSAMHAELEKERQAKEKAADLEQENKELLKQLSALQEERSRLKEQVSGLQGRMAELQGTFLCPREVQQRLEELRKNITTGKGVISSADILGRSLLQLQQDLQCVVSAAQTDRDEALRSQDSLSKEMASLRDSLRSLQDLYNLTKHSEEMCGAHEAEVRRLEEELQEVHEQQYLMAQRLEEAEDEREHLQAELEDHNRLASESHTAQLQSLDLELQELRRSFATADKMAAMHLNTAKNQLHSLHSTAKKISQERAQDAKQLESTRIQAAQAAQDLEAAEAEIRYVQRLLRERLHGMDRNSHNSTVKQKQLEKLNRTLRKQQAQTKRLQDQLAQARADKNGNLEELLDEIESLRNILQQQNSYLSSGEPRQSRGYWYYVPTAPIAPSLGSQGTQDSGLGSQYPPSPERVHHTSHRTRRERVPPASGGYWVYSPHAPWASNIHTSRDGQDSVCESGTNDSTSESNLTPPHDNHHYTLLHDCTPLPPGTFVYTSAVAMLSQNGDNVSYGPHTSRLTVPFIPAGVLHCNMLGHQDMERKLRELERRVREKESSETGQNDSELQRDQLQQEIKALRRSLNRLQHQREILEKAGATADELQCLRNEGEVLKEVECVEKTLMRRRAELREADRRLLLAQSDLKDTHAKNKEALKRYKEAEKHVEDTEREMEEMEHRAQDCATQLVHTKQQLRNLHEEVEELQKKREHEGQALRGVEEVLASQDTQFHELSRKLETTTEKLEAQQRALQEANKLHAELLESCKEAEDTLIQRKKDLERLDTELTLQKEELAARDWKLGQWHEEERELKQRVEQHRQTLEEVLQQGEEETHELHAQIKELQAEVQALSVKRGEVDSQLSERKSHLFQIKQEQQKEDEVLQGMQSQVSKHKADLKHILEMIELEMAELQGLKLQHKQCLDQLEKGQLGLLQTRVELQDLQQEAQTHQGEVEQRRRLLEQETAELEEMRTAGCKVKEELESASKERAKLVEQCRHLEARRGHAERCLVRVEEAARVAESERTKLQAGLERLRQEENLRNEMRKETTATRQQLEDESEELNRLKKEVEEAQQHLEEIGEEVRAATKKRDKLLKQQQDQRTDLQDKSEEVVRKAQQKENLEQQLKELEAEVSIKRAQLVQQEQALKDHQHEHKETEELLKQRQQKLHTQLQSLEGALTQRVQKMEQVTAAVTDVEERACRQSREKQRPEVEQRDQQLRWQADQMQALRGELAGCRLEIQYLQEALNTERSTTEGRLEAHTKEQAELQRHLTAAEQAAQEYQENAKALQKELNVVSKELLSFKDKLHSQEEGERRSREIKEIMRSLKSDVRAELNSGVVDLDVSDISSTYDSDNHKENDPLMPSKRPAFSVKDEQWRGEVLRERLRQQEDDLKVKV